MTRCALEKMPKIRARGAPGAPLGPFLGPLGPSGGVRGGREAPPGGDPVFLGSYTPQKGHFFKGAACHGGKPLGILEGATCHGGKPLGSQALQNVILWSRRAFQGTPGHEISFHEAEM